jgi:hypothetical protein
VSRATFDTSKLMAIKRGRPGALGMRFHNHWPVEVVEAGDLRQRAKLARHCDFDAILGDFDRFDMSPIFALVVLSSCRR